MTQSGLRQEWFGRVILSPPWGKFEAKGRLDCSKKVCARRGYHLREDFPRIWRVGRETGRRISLGWRMLRFTDWEVKSGLAWQMISTALQGARETP